MKKYTTLALCIALVTQLAACGTLLYPERRGQSSGNIDPSIAILNGIGLLLFLVPGLVAFAIDFATGAIYLPGGRAQLSPAEMDSLVAGNTVVKSALLKLIAERTGMEIDSEAASRLEVRQL